MKTPLSVISLITLLFPVMLCAAGDYSRSETEDTPPTGKVSRIVIDPGHGGKDPGTNVGKVLEKDITLDIALRLGAMIKKNMPDAEVFYTRTKDTFVELNRRTDIANKANADLFLSIHVNAAKSSDANGVRTYIMGHDKSGANLDIVMQENEVIKYETDFETTYEGFKADDPVSYMIFQLQQFSYQSQSMMMAEIIQKHYARELPLLDGGAFQDGFLVLWRTSMPSVLTEVGFMTNRSDRDYISSEDGRNETARSLFNAFSEYRSRVEGRSSMVQLQPETLDSAREAEVGRKRSAQVDGTAAAGASSQPKSRRMLPDISSAATQEAPPVVYGSTSQSEIPAAKPPFENVPDNTSYRDRAESDPALRTGAMFYVQVLASRNQVNIHDAAFKSYSGRVEERYVQGSEFCYKYLLGGVSHYRQAEATLAGLKKDFPGAFIVAFDGDRQIPITEAQKR